MIIRLKICNDLVVSGGSDNYSETLRVTTDCIALIVKHGDISKETTDAIVNSTNTDLILGGRTLSIMFICDFKIPTNSREMYNVSDEFQRYY